MTRGKPRKFKDEKQIIELFIEFCDEIASAHFDRIPSQTNFCKWLERKHMSCDRKTIYRYLNEYCPTIKKDFEQIQSDIIAEGAMLGFYQTTMSIFALKNWCKWQDTSKEDKDDTLNKLDDVLSKIIG